MPCLCPAILIAVVLAASATSYSVHTNEVNPEPYAFEPTWESLDARPLPSWYDRAKIGIFIHWGVFSVPSFGSEWFWTDWAKENGSGPYSDFMAKNYPPNFTYQDFARDFKAEFYNPDQWADLFKASGAIYVVLTSKHHEGYTLWPSKYSFSWNAMDVGPRRDVLGELADSIRRRTDIKFGIYHSLYEWYNPLYLNDKNHNFTQRNFVTHKTQPELYELIEKYRPEVIWSDGDWEADDSYWGSKEFLAWLYNESPVRDNVVVNDRWGVGTGCSHGGFFNCADRYSPGVLQAHKWENALTIDRESWGYRRNAVLADYLTIEELLEELVKTVSCGGNVLINVGPTKEGTINPIFEERLRQIGKWLEVNGDAIYDSQPWTFQNDTVTPGVWYTKRFDEVYATSLNWPKNGFLNITAPELDTGAVITMLADNSNALPYTIDGDTIQIEMPEKADLSVQWAYTFKITKVKN